MNTKGKIVAFIVVLIVALAVVALLQPFSSQLSNVGPQIPDLTPTPSTSGGQATSTPTPTATSSTADLIHVTSVKSGDTVSSPLTVSGEARGTWYFEASFPVQLRDSSGKVIAQNTAQAKSDWMTTNFVPFSVTLTFPKQVSGSKGTLILRKDNPSGRPETEAWIEIPVVFK
jgi:hypothetical protein